MYRRPMLPAVAWDAEDRPAPSVLGRLRARARRLDHDGVVCQVVALLFVQPDSQVIATALRRKDYFDARSGELWDLYFAGYYRYGRMPRGRALTDASDGPQFSPPAFDEMRRLVESQSGWRYSGDSDLVVVNAYLARGEEPLVDWPSLLGGPIVDANDRYNALSLGGVVEAISQGVERNYEAADWNVGDRLWPPDRGPDPKLRAFGRDVLTNAVAAVLTSPLSGGG